MNYRISRFVKTVRIIPVVWMTFAFALALLMPALAPAQSGSDYGFYPSFLNGQGDCWTGPSGGVRCATASDDCDSIQELYNSPYGNVLQTRPAVQQLLGYDPGLTCFYRWDGDSGAALYLSLPSGATGDQNSPTGSAPPGPGGVMVAKQIGGGNCGCSDPNNPDDNQTSGDGNAADPSQSTGPTGGSYGGEPINIPTGNLAYHMTDYTTAGQNPLGFTRYFNSRGTFVGMFGSNWRTSYDRDILIFSPTSVLVQRADGQTFSFTLAGGVWTTDTDVDYKLSGSGTSWTLTDPDDTVETYSTTPAWFGQGILAVPTTLSARNGYTKTLTYNSYGQLSNIADSYGRSLILAYNTNGTLNTLTTPDSTVITYGYTGTGYAENLTSVTFPTSPATTLTYVYANPNLPKTLTGVTDENGNTFLTWTYDAYGRALSSQIGTGATATITSVSYNDTTGSRIVTNPLGVQDTYSYSTLQGAQKVTQISRAATSTTAAATRTFTYDTNGYLASATDWKGIQTTYVNNSHGLPTTIHEAVGKPETRTTTISYDPTFVHLPHQVITTGLTSTFVYDTSGNVHTRTDADTTTQTVPYSTNGQTRTWTYTYSNFLLASVQNPRTDVTAITNFGYAPSGALTSITDALSHVTNITSYTGGGQPLTIVDPNGATNGTTTTLTYDGRQRLTGKAVATSIGTLTTTYTLDPAGELTKVTLPDSTFFSYAYDTAHRVTKITNGLSEYIQYTLDALGDQTGANTYDSSATLWRQHSGTFDALGRQLTDVGGMGQTTTYTRDNNGNAITVKDGLNHLTSQAFDSLNRLTTVTDANTPTHGVTHIGYDTHDRVLSVSDPNSHVTTHVYDGSGDAIQQVSPDTGTTVYYYDLDSNLTQKVDALAVTTTNAYDKLDRLTVRNFPADTTQNVVYTYDKTGYYFGAGVGRLSTVTDPAGFVNIFYDSFGHVGSTSRYTMGGTDLANVYYAYDSSGRMKGYTYPSGMYVGFGYDGADNIGSVQSVPPGMGSGPTVAWLAYGPFSGPVRYTTWGNSVQVNSALDEDYRITTFQVIATSGNLTNRTFTYDAANNLKTVVDTVSAFNNQTLGYDTLNRLTSAVSGTGGYGSLGWTYDKVGNLLTQTVGSSTTSYGYTSGTNRLASITNGGTTNVTTNANGNITSIPPANGTTAATFGYSLANRLASVTGTSTAISSIIYDGFGQRYSKQNPGSNPITYTHDLAGNLIEENNNGSVTDYMYVNGVPVGIFVPGGSSGTLYYVHPDRQGTPQIVTNSAQAVVWSTTYQPYGTTPTIVSSITQNLRFPGQNFDLETGFNHNGARDYMPNLGRYLEADPIGLRGGINPYRYANTNPGRFTDRTGKIIPLVIGEAGFELYLYLTAADIAAGTGTTAFVESGALALQSTAVTTINSSPLLVGTSVAVITVLTDENQLKEGTLPELEYLYNRANLINAYGSAGLAAIADQLDDLEREANELVNETNPDPQGGQGDPQSGQGTGPTNPPSTCPTFGNDFGDPNFPGPPIG